MKFAHIACNRRELHQSECRISETIFRFVAHAYPSLAYNFRARKQIRLRLCFSRSPVFAYEIFRQHGQFLAHENVSHPVCAYVRKLTQTNLVVNHATHYAHMIIHPSDELDIVVAE